MSKENPSSINPEIIRKKAEALTGKILSSVPPIQDLSIFRKLLTLLSIGGSSIVDTTTSSEILQLISSEQSAEITTQTAVIFSQISTILNPPEKKFEK